MPRIARIVVSGEAHHVVQRGNRRLPTFFCEADYQLYLELVREWCDRHCVAIWCYCLMTNHVHLIAVPETESGLRLAFGEAHRRYSLHVNKREGWTGHLWQDRFSSFVMDEAHALAAARYIERNPVRAGMVSDPADYPWSSALAHLQGRDDILVKAGPLLSMVPDWRSFIASGDAQDAMDALSKHARTGRPLGNDAFFDRLQARTGVDLRPRKPGPKKRN
ncbi:transposase [Pseudodesulfovibrio sp. S3]|uniref:transposase n=1 Tax=Pseudodesulfovibrio sp. S3 TaxID=2283629 RepID=UPI000FEB892B|nr:transposase [Pseudodesulfovibrio sp. S3]RWU06865.1 transposase [Pseudodesulfovibrio sp. S3]